MISMTVMNCSERPQGTDGRARGRFRAAAGRPAGAGGYAALYLTIAILWNHFLKYLYDGVS